MELSSELVDLIDNADFDEGREELIEKLRQNKEFFKGAKIYFVTAIFASLMMTLLNSLTPQIFKFTIDSVLGSEVYPFLKENLWVMASLIIATALFSGLFMFLCRYRRS